MSLSSALLGMVGLLTRALAWGPDGHTIVAHIADHYLSPEVDSVLRTDVYNMSLNEVSDWADNFDHSADGRWSEALHFIDYPGKACKFDWAIDCKKDWCNAGAIVNYTKQVFDPSISKDDRFFALKFVVHMVGDIHQPLHVSSGDNLGGNAIKLPKPHFSPREQLASTTNKRHYKTNLHAVWDGGIVVQDIQDIEDDAALKVTKPPFVPHYHKWQLLANLLEKRMKSEWASKQKAWQATMAGSRNEATFRSGLSIVAGESATLGCEYAYNYADGSAVKSGDVLDREYYLRAQPIVEEQLAKGGVRLAQLLSEALARSRAQLSSVIV